MKIKALVPFSNGTISMEQYEVREVTDSLGNELISAGIAVEIGGGGLPPVTASDNGKVATVVGGAWAAQSNDIVLNATISFASNPKIITITSQLPNMTEIASWYENGRTIMLQSAVNYTYVRLFPMSKSTYDSGDTFTYIYGADFYWDGDVLHYRLQFHENDGVATAYGTLVVGDKFIVTLTPTSADFSGTMDKTVAEIDAAYEAGQEIWFKVLTSASTAVEIPLTYWATDSSYDYHGFEANLVNVSSNVLIVAYVGSSNDGTRQTYSTYIYSLTPAT